LRYRFAGEEGEGGITVEGATSGGTKPQGNQKEQVGDEIGSVSHQVKKWEICIAGR